MNQNTELFRCGYIAVVGRPNVGKSTLINRFLGQKISITSSRPQTTRHRILGIKTEADYQAIFIDTPGIHLNEKRAINRYMNRAASNALFDIDIIIFVVEAERWTDEDELVLNKVIESKQPVILIANKIDYIKNKKELLPLFASFSSKMDFAEIIPVSAKNGDGLDSLETIVKKYLPVSEMIFDESQVTDKSMRFIAAEVIREKLIRRLGQEIPYRLTVEIEDYEVKGKTVHISAIIWVESKGHKSIVIGNNGDVLKTIGSQARETLESMIEKKIYLTNWVKIKENWSDDDRILQSLGYTE